MNRIAETIFRGSRFYVKILTDGKTKTLPRANYVWLKYNPSFKEIPKGYVIHHLDLDPTNDDPSNLVLMHKHQHVAFHWKYKSIISEIKIEPDQKEYHPLKKPTVYFDKKYSRHVVYFKELSDDGKRKSRFLWTIMGEKIGSKEEAEWACNWLWHREKGEPFADKRPTS